MCLLLCAFCCTQLNSSLAHRAPLHPPLLCFSRNNRKVKYLAFGDDCVRLHVTVRISPCRCVSAHCCLAVCLRGSVCVHFLCVGITLSHDSLLCWLVAASLHHRSKRSLNLHSCFDLKNAIVFSIILRRFQRRKESSSVLMVFTQKEVDLGRKKSAID